MAPLPPTSNTGDSKPPFMSSKPPSSLTFETALPWCTDEDRDYAWREPELDFRVNPYVNKTLSQWKKIFRDDGSTIGLVILHGFEAVERLKRFVDRRQTKMTEAPQRDGGNLFNIGSDNQTAQQSAGEKQPCGNMSELLRLRANHPVDDLAHQHQRPKQHPWGQQLDGSRKTPFVRRVYDFYVRWLTFLHYETIFKLDPNCRSKTQMMLTVDRSRLDEFYNDLARAPSDFLEVEKLEQLEQQPGQAYISQPEHGFEWVEKLEQIVPDALASVIAARRWSALRRENIRDGEAQAWDSIPPMVRLILILQAKEYEFEHKLTSEHVEDIAYKKRVTILSPKEAAACGRTAMVELTKFFEPRLRETIARVQRQLREVHDFRLLRDWGYGRPWKKLFFLFDTLTDRKVTDKLGYRPLCDCINELLVHLHSSRKAYDLFDYHPMDFTEYSKEPSCCSICMTEFEPNSSIMQLWCSHIFHPACVLEYWDFANRYIYKCPNCRHSPPALRERVQFEAEKSDIDITEDNNREWIDSEMNFNIRNARRLGYRPVDLPEEYRIFLLQNELSRVNAQRREDESASGEGITAGFPLSA